MTAPTNLAQILGQSPAAPIELAELAYLAGVIDLLAVIRTRRTDVETELPYVAISGPHIEALTHLGRLTGTRTVTTRRHYHRVGCSEHCADRHLEVTSQSARWSVTGVKATILLHNLRPFLRIQAEAATSAMNVGLNAPFKPQVVKKMHELGWTIPAGLDRKGAA